MRKKGSVPALLPLVGLLITLPKPPDTAQIWMCAPLSQAEEDEDSTNEKRHPRRVLLTRTRVVASCGDKLYPLHVNPSLKEG